MDHSHINNSFSSINNPENNSEHSKKSPIHVQFDEHEEERYGDLEMGEETPLLKQRCSSRSPSSVSPPPFDNSSRKRHQLHLHQKHRQHLQKHPLSNNYAGLRNLQDYVVNMSTSDSNETNSYEETDSESGTVSVSSNATTLQQRHTRAQSDVCFPMAESAGFKRPVGIDYEALENYVREENEKRRHEHRHRQRRLSESVSAFVRKKSMRSEGYNNHCSNLEINKVAIFLFY